MVVKSGPCGGPIVEADGVTPARRPFGPKGLFAPCSCGHETPVPFGGIFDRIEDAPYVATGSALLVR